MKQIKDLKPHNCVEIAKIVYPEIEWRYVVSDNKWNGHDLVGDLIDSNFSEYNDYFQIGFDGEYSYFDAGLNEYKILGEEKLKVNNYIKNL